MTLSARLVRSYSSAGSRALCGSLVVLGLAPGIYRAEPELFGPVHVLLLVAVLVVSPLALALAAIPAAAGKPPFVYRAASLIWPFAALSTAVAFLFPAGRTAAILAAPWLLFAALAAGFGLQRFYLRKGARLRLADLCIDIGLIHFVFAARWLWFSRAGIQPPKVSELLVALTAIHFHYTFFAASLLVGLLGQGLADPPRAAVKRGYVPTALGVLLGPMLVATGINTGLPAIEVFGATLLAVSLIASAGLTAFCAARAVPRVLSRRLLQAASCALGVAMLLAAFFAITKYTGSTSLSLERMIRSHGILNVLFVVGSLVGWYTARARSIP